MQSRSQFCTFAVGPTPTEDTFGSDTKTAGRSRQQQQATGCPPSPLCFFHLHGARETNRFCQIKRKITHEAAGRQYSTIYTSVCQYRVACTPCSVSHAPLSSTVGSPGSIEFVIVLRPDIANTHTRQTHTHTFAAADRHKPKVVSAYSTGVSHSRTHQGRPRIQLQPCPSDRAWG